jgi:threonine/homoserine/homoserine lactone efflux protein
MIVKLIGVFFSAYGIAFSGAVMPGPLLSAAIRETPRRGFITGPLLIAGHALLDGLLLVGLFFGLAPFLRKDAVFAVIALAGAAIMIWMAVGMFRSLPNLTLSWEKEATGRRKSLPLTGIVMSLANPYWAVWWATIGLAYVVQSKTFGIPGVTLFFLGHILGDLTWYSFITGAVSQGKRLLTDRRYRILVGVCALFLSGFAGFFLYSGITRVF